MDIFLYVMLFIMGTFFGSFFTLAVYRIPLKKDITHEHSFCPNCNHKLGILDLIPVWSYLFLKGKCRYCGEKVRIRYLLLEVLSGLAFLMAYTSFHIQDIFLDTEKQIAFIAFVFMYITIVIIAGIDKEYRKINSSVVLFGTICQTLYIVYLYVLEHTTMYRYIIYFMLFIILWILQKKKKAYWLEILLLLSYILLVFDFKSLVPILVLTICVEQISKIKYKKIENMPIGFMIGISTIMYSIVENFIEFWII